MTKIGTIIIEIIREISFLIWAILRDKQERDKRKKKKT